MRLFSFERSELENKPEYRFSVFIGEYMGHRKPVFWHISRRLYKTTRRKPVLPYAGFLMSPLLIT